MSDRLSLLLQEPTPVRLGGREYPVYEARVLELARLQAWLDRARDRPLDDALARLDDPGLDGAARDRVLFDALDPLDGPRPTWRNPEGARLLASGEGLLVFLAVALARGTPDLSAADVAGVAASATPAEFWRLRSAFYGVDREAQLAEALFRPYRSERRPRGKPVGWLEAVDGVARAYGWTYGDVLGLSLSQFRAAMFGGRVDEERGVTLHPDRLGEVMEDMARRRAAAYAPAPDEGGGA